jgi:hypothetical protein
MMMFSSDSLVNITSPLDLDSLFYWYAADVGVTTNNNKVTQWNDLSGNGYHVTQADTSKAPTYSAAGGPGSRPTMTFDGTDDFMASAAHWWGSDDITVIVVYKHNNATLNQQESIISRLEGGTNNRQWRLYGREAAQSYKMEFSHYQSGTAAPLYQNQIGAKEASYRLHSAVKADASNTVTWWKDGASQTVTQAGVTGDGTIHNSSTPPLVIGAVNANSTPALFLQGSISEIIVYSRPLTTGERTAIENYLNKKYDLY